MRLARCRCLSYSEVCVCVGDDGDAVAELGSAFGGWYLVVGWATFRPARSTLQTYGVSYGEGCSHIYTPPCKIHTVNVWPTLRGGVCV